MARPHEEKQTTNQPVNPSIIIALRHTLAAIGNLQSVSGCTEWEELLLRHTTEELARQVARLEVRS
ncbi:MAG: hypothetical protein PHO57_05400 [Acidithiobacillus sp.]|nr:hypothetical protein [Acidithiobacillus sp.]